MKIEITEIKKTRNNNLNLILVFEYISDEYVNTHVACTFDNFLTVHGKTGKKKFDAQECEMQLTLKKEKDIEQFLYFIGFQDNFFNFSSFAFPVYRNFECEFIRIQKEHEYRNKLFSSINFLYQELLPTNEDWETVEDVDAFFKERFNFQSKAELTTEKLEEYRNKLFKIKDSLEFEKSLQDKEDEPLPF